MEAEAPLGVTASALGRRWRWRSAPLPLGAAQRMGVDDLAAALLTSLVQGVAIRWALGARDFDLRAEGLRLFDAQCRLLAAEGE